MKRVISVPSIIGAISVALFVSVELAAAAATTVWALSGLLALGKVATMAAGAIVAAPTIYGIIRVCMLAISAETDPENN